MSKSLTIPLVAQVGMALGLVVTLLACGEQPTGQPNEPLELTWELEGESLRLHSPGLDTGYLVIGAPTAEPVPGQEPEVRVVGGSELSLRAPALVYELRLRLDCPPGMECNPCSRADDCPPVPPPPVPGAEMVVWFPGNLEAQRPSIGRLSGE